MKPGSDGIIWSWEGQEMRVGYDRQNLYPGWIQLKRSPDDEPHIVEVWL